MSNNDTPESPPPAPPQIGDESQQPDEVVETSTAETNTGVEDVSLDEIDAAWTPYFRYDTVYADQVDAIESFLTLLSDNGIYLLEGACGTGKTLAAVTGGIHAIRDRDNLTETYDTNTFPNYERLLVVTPVKQQLKQFVEEMQGVNQSLPDDHDQIPTVVMRGRGDMLPYSNVTLESIGSGSLGDQADSLRDMARTAMNFDSDIPLNWPAEIDPPEFSRADYDWSEADEPAEQAREQFKYDPWRAEAITQIVADLADSPDTDFDHLTVDGVTTPYPDYVPHTNDIVDTDALRDSSMGQLPTDLQGKFDPFYVGFFASDEGPGFGFEHAANGVFDREQLFTAAASRGICPHETMAALAAEAEVVLGNYNHLFDPLTRMLTDEKIGLIDDETIVVVDEAHQIESRVRDMLSAELDIYTLNKAIKDVQIVRQYATGDHEQTPTPDLDDSMAARARSLVNQALETVSTFEADVEDLRHVEELLMFTKQKLGEYGADALADEYSNSSWQQALENLSLSRIEESLSDPESITMTDQFTEDVLARSFTEESFYDVYRVMLAVDFAYDQLREEGILDREPQGVRVGHFFRRWTTADRVEYHRQAVLDDQLKEDPPEEFPEWVRGWTPKLTLFNCVPADELRGIFAKVGGGVLMSATIRPADVFKEGVGIDKVPYPEDDADEETTSHAPRSTIDRPDPESLTDDELRPTGFDQYPLRFPPENRLSITVDLPKFTYRNRGQPIQDLLGMTETRKEYAATLMKIVQSPGNVLIALPNYGEAEWAYDLIESRDVDKRLHLDQSTGSQKTTETLDAFFAEGEAVIFTSALGTITEGVDYDGAKLHTCAVVGIPLKPTNQSRTQAIRTAYDERMSTYSGFDSSLTIPAVRKVRQAFGRVIRGDDEVGVRALLDERYAADDWAGVEEYLSEQEQAEFSLLPSDHVSQALEAFWDDVE